MRKQLPKKALRKKTSKPATPSGGGSYFSGPARNVEFISTGAATLDCSLGGGWPERRIINIVGDKSTGKTLLAIEACANYARKYAGKSHRIRYVEAEAAFDMEYAAALGLPVDVVELEDGIDTVEALYNDLEKTINESKNDQPTLYIIDSLDALSDASEQKRDIEDKDYNRKPAQLSILFRKLTKKMASANVTMIIVSQVRENIGVTFGEKYRRSGGKALDFYASIVLWLAHTGQVKKTKNKQERVVGVDIRTNCKKNKVSMPFRKSDIRITFGYGVDDFESNLMFLESIKADMGSLAEPKILRQRVPKMSGEEFLKTRRELDRLARQYWYDLEEAFLPKQAKELL